MNLIETTVKYDNLEDAEDALAGPEGHARFYPRLRPPPRWSV